MPKSKAVAKLSPTALALAGTLEQAASAIRLASGDMPFLRLLKSGEWVYGGDDTDVEEGSLWAVDPNSFSMGFQAWGDDADLLGEVIHLVTEQPVLRSDLKEVDGEWKSLMGCTLVCIEGESEGVQVSYKVTSKGGIKAVGKLMSDLVTRIKSNPKDGTYIPVVALDMDFYKHKTYGRIYTPVFKIEEWTDEDELMAGDVEPDEGALEDEDEEEARLEAELAAAEKAEAEAAAKAEKPKRKSRAKKEPEIEVVTPEPEEETPPPRRRRARK
jgi:hypothetical protein